MFALSLKNRIAFYYSISTTLLIFVVFIIIYSIVSFSVHKNVNDNINFEVEEYLDKIQFVDNQTRLNDKNEWIKQEHNEISVNPVFLVLSDKNGKVIEKSENLRKESLRFTKNSQIIVVSDFKLGGKLVREIQVPLIKKNQVLGYLLVAVSLEEATNILNNLQNILLVIFPIVLTLLFFVVQFITGRSIKPILNIIETADKISQENLNSRIDLPKNKDELQLLSQTINDLLDRIQNAVEREKQLTSDASHELRTPLAVIKGTLEVLIRKPRNQTEYLEKINFCISEVDRVNNLVSQLLLLARFENQKQNIKHEEVSLNAIFLDVLSRYSDKIKNKGITVKHHFSEDYIIKSDTYLISIVIGNLISNALKYSNENGEISIDLSNDDSTIIVSIFDNGIGISKDNINRVFDPFFRSEPNDRPEVKGTGLGLSIVRRICILLDVDIKISSVENIGTKVILRISKEDVK
ncbi:BaeS Signal transduction histidine kinase [Flavobacteriaceae bacterium]